VPEDTDPEVRLRERPRPQAFPRGGVAGVAEAAHVAAAQVSARVAGRHFKGSGSSAMACNDDSMRR
jgi:hypothetical protein